MNKIFEQKLKLFSYPSVLTFILGAQKETIMQGTKIHSSTRNYEWNLERMTNSSQSTHPVGQMILKELLQDVIILYTG